MDSPRLPSQQIHGVTDRFGAPFPLVQILQNLARQKSMTPRTQAIAFRLWAYASPRGWDCTVGGAADAIGITRGTAYAVIRSSGWGGRFRSTYTPDIDVPHSAGMFGIDAVLA